MLREVGTSKRMAIYGHKSLQQITRRRLLFVTLIILIDIDRILFRAAPAMTPVMISEALAESLWREPRSKNYCRITAKAAGFHIHFLRW